MLSLFITVLLQTASVAEEPVDPYPQSNANAGAKPVAGTALWTDFHGAAGVSRIVDDLVARSERDPRITDIFKAHDMVRLQRTLKEQFCYILNGGCNYTGRDMVTTHKDLGLQTADMGALVENLQAAMRTEHVPNFAQNRLLAKLAPMKRDVLKK